MAEKAGLILIKCLFKSNLFKNYNWFPPAMPLTKPLHKDLWKAVNSRKIPLGNPFSLKKELTEIFKGQNLA